MGTRLCLFPQLLFHFLVSFCSLANNLNQESLNYYSFSSQPQFRGKKWNIGVKIQRVPTAWNKGQGSKAQVEISYVYRVHREGSWTGTVSVAHGYLQVTTYVTQGTCFLQKKMVRQGKIAWSFPNELFRQQNEKVFEYMKLENVCQLRSHSQKWWEEPLLI